jgi:hypothetical protein
MKRLVSAALVAIALMVTGAAAWVHLDRADPDPGSAPIAVTRAPQPDRPTPTPPTTPRPEPARPEHTPPAVEPRTPERLRLWKFDAPVIPIELDGDTLVPPDDPTVLGWWGRPAGAAQGTTLLVGHTVSTGGGTFDDLEHTPVGEIANVSGVRYRVERVDVITKAQLADRAPRLFDQAGEPRLVLVTCEGWNPATRTYSHNVVVVAQPL